MPKPRDPTGSAFTVRLSPDDVARLDKLLGDTSNRAFLERLIALMLYAPRPFVQFLKGDQVEDPVQTARFLGVWIEMVLTERKQADRVFPTLEDVRTLLVPPFSPPLGAAEIAQRMMGTANRPEAQPPTEVDPQMLRRSSGVPPLTTPQRRHEGD